MRKALTDRPSTPRLLAISDRRSVELDTWLDQLGDALSMTAGALPSPPLAVLLREKDLDDRALFELAIEARRRLPTSVPLLIHGRADIAVAAGAQGVHLASASGPYGTAPPPLRELCRCFGAALDFGVSTHHVDGIAAAHRDGAAYVTFSPVFTTPGKGSPVGLEVLRQAVAAAPVPVLALGGIEANKLAAVAATGAHGIAGIRCFQQPHVAATLRAATSTWPAEWPAEPVA